MKRQKTLREMVYEANARARVKPVTRDELDRATRAILDHAQTLSIARQLGAHIQAPGQA